MAPVAVDAPPMIEANLATEAFLQRLKVTATRLGQDRGALLVAAQKRARINWRSAGALWPEFGQD